MKNKEDSRQLPEKSNNRTVSEEFGSHKDPSNLRFFKPVNEYNTGAYSYLLRSLESILESNSSLKSIKKSFAHEAKVQISRLNNKEDIASLYDLLNKLNTNFKKIRERRHFKKKR